MTTRSPHVREIGDRAEAEDDLERVAVDVQNSSRSGRRRRGRRVGRRGGRRVASRSAARSHIALDTSTRLLHVEWTLRAHDGLLQWKLKENGETKECGKTEATNKKQRTQSEKPLEAKSPRQPAQSTLLPQPPHKEKKEEGEKGKEKGRVGERALDGDSASVAEVDHGAALRVELSVLQQGSTGSTYHSSCSAGVPPTVPIGARPMSASKCLT